MLGFLVFIVLYLCFSQFCFWMQDREDKAKQKAEEAFNHKCHLARLKRKSHT